MRIWYAPQIIPWVGVQQSRNRTWVPRFAVWCFTTKLFLAIVPKARSNYVDLQMCKRKCSNVCDISGAVRRRGCPCPIIYIKLGGHQAHSGLLVLLIVVMLSLFGLLGVYASESTVSSQQRGVGKELENVAGRKTLLWKGAKQIPWLLHRMELNGSCMLINMQTTNHFRDAPK